ncbi:hypothetical protein [Fusibacter ferrireducens]|uniref:Uncharacterized protein n=1 Tax=Fusibacter ferrireducens TaxID=2785058 RepID=A0ABR9ZY43_9FIRM|nr:hypothetical protein [Fusibacter ferrireducens]MBF4695380.1 hypothetical protein [Fusibacter ferrireducens]
MDFRKVGIKILIISILGAVLFDQLHIKGTVVIALTVFGIGSGLVLILLGDLSKFEK